MITIETKLMRFSNTLTNTEKNDLFLDRLKPSKVSLLASRFSSLASKVSNLKSKN